MKTVVVSGSFDDLRSRDMRFLQEASKRGELHVLLWSDELTAALTGRAPKFSLEERRYFLQAIRYLSGLTVVEELETPDALPRVEERDPDVWAVDEAEDNEAKRRYAEAHGLTYEVISEQDLSGFPVPTTEAWTQPTEHQKVIVTGCFDWLHTGHVRFFEEVSALGDLYVAVGNDANVRHLKGEGHPEFPEDERRYMVQSIRYVKQAVITKGAGWMDAAPNIAEIQPDIYAVNEDGDKPEKAEFCEGHGLNYVVLQRVPKEGLPRRSSTDLRGF
jgi:cytidyltransferase-like protein